MARMIDADIAYRFLTEQLVKESGAFSKGVNKGLNIARSAMRNPDAIPTLTPPPASPDLISRSALLRGETEPEIITGSDSELAEHMEWERWMDKIKRAPAVDKEEEP